MLSDVAGAIKRDSVNRHRGITEILLKYWDVNRHIQNCNPIVSNRSSESDCGARTIVPLHYGSIEIVSLAL